MACRNSWINIVQTPETHRQPPPFFNTPLSSAIGVMCLRNDDMLNSSRNIARGRKNYRCQFRRKFLPMHRLLLALTVGFFMTAVESVLFAGEVNKKATTHKISIAANDWPWWRGPHRNGIAAADQSPPLRWSRIKNVLWKSPLPGRGHGSVTVMGDQVLLAAVSLCQG